MPRPISALAVLVLAFGAMADEPDLAPVSSLTVDLERVVELGTVSPVDGITSAGQPDNENAIIMALEFKPTQIQIGGFVAAGIADSSGNRPEFACVEDNAIIVDDYIKGNPFRRLAWPEVR